MPSGFKLDLISSRRTLTFCYISKTPSKTSNFKCRRNQDTNVENKISYAIMIYGILEARENKF